MRTLFYIGLGVCLAILIDAVHYESPRSIGKVCSVVGVFSNAAALLDAEFQIEMCRNSLTFGWIPVK